MTKASLSGWRDNVRWLLPILIALPTFAFAGEHPILKKTDPNTLGLYVFAENECPFSIEELRKKIEGEYLRARIKATGDPDAYLQVKASCMTLYVGGKTSGIVVYTDIRFGTVIRAAEFGTKPGEITKGMLINSPHYSLILSGMPDSKSYFLNGISDQVADALTDYLAENF